MGGRATPASSATKAQTASGRPIWASACRSTIRQFRSGAAAPQLEQERRRAEYQQQAHGGGRAAAAQHRIGKRAIGDELALGNEDDPRHGEQQHEREAEQRIDRAVGQAVLKQECEYRRVHPTPPSGPRSICFSAFFAGDECRVSSRPAWTEARPFAAFRTDAS